MNRLYVLMEAVVRLLVILNDVRLDGVLNQTVLKSLLIVNFVVAG